MFTGIIESKGQIINKIIKGSNNSFWIQSLLTPEFKIDQSISHDGICLTIEEIVGDKYLVTAIDETIKKTNISTWKEGDFVNLERCMIMNGRLDGHIVQGHVDATANCIQRIELEGSWEFCFNYPTEFSHLLIEKGSVAVNGTSLTCFDVTRDQFKVAIIPYTYEHTSIHQLKVGSLVNIEFDVIGKYIAKWQSLK